MKTVEYEYQCPRCLEKGRVSFFYDGTEYHVKYIFTKCVNEHDLIIRFENGEWKETMEKRK